jgi:hypothetical protein
MSTNGIVDTIRTELLMNFLGKGKAKHRGILLSRCHYHTPKLKDRRMRLIYAKILPVGWCKKGIYVIDKIQEVEKMIKTETSRKNAIEEKILMLERHREFLRQRDMGQMDLFGGVSDG